VLAKLFFPKAVWPHVLKPQATGRVSLLQAGEAAVEIDWDPQSRGGVLSSPLLEHRETFLSGRQPGGRWSGCGAELSGGVSFL